MSLIGGHNLNFRKLIFLSVGIVGVFATSGFISNVYADGNFLSACGHFNTIPDRPIAYPTTTGVFADFCSINPIMIQPPDPPLPDLPLPPAPYVMSGTIIAGAHPDGPGLGLSQNIIVDGGSPVGTPLHYRNGEIIITSTFDFANSFKSRGLFIVEPNARVDVFAGGKIFVDRQGVFDIKGRLVLHEGSVLQMIGGPNAADVRNNLENGGFIEIHCGAVLESDSLALIIGRVNFTFVPCPDTDGDGLIDVDDNCPNNANPSQSNIDLDAQGDACDLSNIVTLPLTNIGIDHHLVSGLVISPGSLLVMPEGCGLSNWLITIPLGSDLLIQPGGGILMHAGCGIQIGN